MSVLPHIYPDSLTKKDWDKNKGAFAKLAGKTGMGEQMEKLEKAWKAIKVENIDPDKVLYGAKGNDPEKALSLAKEEHAKCLAAQKEAYALRDLAKKTAETFKKNKLIPKKSAEHVEAVQTTADHFGVALKLDLIGQHAKEAKTAIDEGEKHAALRELGLKEVKALVEKAKKEIEGIEKNVSAGLSKLPDSMKRQEAIDQCVKDTEVPGCTFMLGRSALPKQHSDLLSKLNPAIAKAIRDRASTAFDSGMRECAALRSLQLKATAVVAKQRLVAEKSTVPSGDAKATASHAEALAKEVDALDKLTTKPTGKAAKGEWSKLDTFFKSGQDTGNWFIYDTKKAETVEAFPYLAELAGYIETQKARAALIPEIDEPAKKAKTGLAKLLETLAKKVGEGLKEKVAFDSLVDKLDKQRK